MTTPSLPDITSRADLVALVDRFYERVRGDHVLGPIFDDVARIDWHEHLPKMYDFWESILFGAGSYHGQPMPVHASLAHKVPLGAEEFGRWLTLFQRTVDDLFTGPSAEEIKTRAARIASVMRYHVGSH